VLQGKGQTAISLKAAGWEKGIPRIFVRPVFEQPLHPPKKTTNGGTALVAPTTSELAVKVASELPIQPPGSSTVPGKVAGVGDTQGTPAKQNEVEVMADAGFAHQKEPGLSMVLEAEAQTANGHIEAIAVELKHGLKRQHCDLGI
jgi:hypothetical protein